MLVGLAILIAASAPVSSYTVPAASAPQGLSGVTPGRTIQHLSLVMIIVHAFVR